MKFTCKENKNPSLLNAPRTVYNRAKWWNRALLWIATLERRNIAPQKKKTRQKASRNEALKSFTHKKSI